MFVAAKVRGLLGCIEFGGALLDPATGSEAGYDARTATLYPGSDGWSAPSGDRISDLSNINACPNYGSREMLGPLWTLRLTARERAGLQRTLTVERTIQLTCDPILGAEGLADCACTCAANYCLGRCQDVADGGAPRDCPR
jgi:hypothetical protein